MNETQKHELFQRVDDAAKYFAGSLRGFAALIGIKYRTFYGYISQERQDNLWPLLPVILDKFPRLSRQWLYFGEGPMVIGQHVPLDAPIPLQELAKAAEHMANDCGGAWGNVLKLVIGQAQEETEQQSVSPEAALELAEARGEILRLHKKLEGLQSEIIGLQKELLAIHKTEKNQANEECPGRTVDTGQTVAPL